VKLNRLFDAFSAGGALDVGALLESAGEPPDASRARWRVVDSDDVLDWVRAVDDVASCQSTDGAPMYNRGLLNRFEDGAVRLVALRDETGATKARAAMRLATLEDDSVALVLDRLYQAAPPRTEEARRMAELVATFARARAASLRVSLVVTESYASTTDPTTQLVDYPRPLGTDYIDAGLHRVWGPRDAAALPLFAHFEAAP
jgi:hypothetical protein